MDGTGTTTEQTSDPGSHAVPAAQSVAVDSVQNPVPTLQDTSRTSPSTVQPSNVSHPSTQVEWTCGQNGGFSPGV